MGFVVDVKQWILDGLHREPRGHKGYWLMVGYGVVVICVAFGSSVVPEIDVGLEFVLLGSAIVVMGAAELVPTDRIPWARNLRIGSYVGFLLYLLWIAGPPLLSASYQTQLLAVAVIPFVLYAWLMYRALEG